MNVLIPEVISRRGIPDLVPAAMAAGAAVVLLGIPWPANLLLLGAMSVMAIAVVNPSMALGLLMLSIPMQTVGEARLESVHLTLTKVLVIAVIVGWLYRVTTRRARWGGGWLTWAYGAHLLVVAVSITNALVISHWSGELYRWWTGFVIFLVALDTVRSVDLARPILVGISLGVIGASIVGFYQVAEGIGPPSFNVGGYTRAYATFGQPNPFAGYLEVSVPVLFAVVVAWITPSLRRQMGEVFSTDLVVLCGVATGLGLIAIALTQSRGGWIGMFCGLAVAIWLFGGGVRWSSIALVGAVVMVALMTPLGSKALDRLDSGSLVATQNVQVTPENFAVQERLAHWRAGIEMVREHPVLGVGAGNFSDRYREFTQVWRFRVDRGHAHNAYIQAAAQTGFLGLATYLGLMLAVAVRLSWALRHATGSGRPLVVGAIAVSVAFATHNFFEYLHVHALPLQLSTVWALAEAGLRLDRANGSNGPNNWETA